MTASKEPRDGKIYYLWQALGVCNPLEDDRDAIKVNIRHWYPGWLVGLICKWKIWRAQ